jgi:hypothetical protein
VSAAIDPRDLRSAADNERAASSDKPLEENLEVLEKTYRWEGCSKGLAFLVTAQVRTCYSFRFEFDFWPSHSRT